MFGSAAQFHSSKHTSAPTRVGGRGSVPKGIPGHMQFCPFAYRAVAALPTFPYTSPPNKLASPNSSGTGANILET